MRKLHKAAAIFTATGMHTLLRLMRPYFCNEVPILTYHRVTATGNNYPFDGNLISASPKTFYQQMKYISSNYHPVSMAEFIEAVDGNKTLPKNAVMVTFDDGFEDNYTNAYPILKEFNIPATFFVATDYIGKHETIWYERLAYFFNRVKVKEVNIKSLHLSFKINKKDKLSHYDEFIEQLKIISNSQRIKILYALYQEYGDPYLNIPTDEDKLSKFMTWEQLKELSQNNMTIAAHSHTHPILSMLSQDKIQYELSESKKMIERNLNTRVDCIAYPDGQEESFSEIVRKETIANKYKVGFSFLPGICDFNNMDRYNIKRLHVNNNDTLSLFKAMLSFPNLFAE